MKNTRILCFLVSSLLLSFITTSCEQFVQVELPNSQISSKAVFENDETAIAAATGMYKTLLDASSFIGEFHPLSYVGGLLSDELSDYSGNADHGELNSNELTADNAVVWNVWSSAYRTIYEANAVIEGVANSGSLSPMVQQQLLGEGKFVRAFCYFYLVNLFGDVALTTSTDYRKNAVLGRAPTLEVYVQIETDLLEASELLSDEYFGPGKIRPNKWAATALLARVYLFLEEFSKAESAANQIIESGMYALPANVNDVFLANSSESILELSQVYPYSYPTADALFFILAGYFEETFLRPEFLSSFEPNDSRRSGWVDSFDGLNFYPNKYKVYLVNDQPDFPENLVLLRLAEVYLIRAEARARIKDLDGSRKDLNVIRNRAGLPDTDASDEALLLAAIEKERRFEFFCEMGHRWLDLKRTGRATAVLGPLKPSWESPDELFPIPEKEMLSNPNLTPQNAGY